MNAGKSDLLVLHAVNGGDSHLREFIRIISEALYIEYDKFNRNFLGITCGRIRCREYKLGSTNARYPGCLRIDAFGVESLVCGFTSELRLVVRGSRVSPGHYANILRVGRVSPVILRAVILF